MDKKENPLEELKQLEKELADRKKEQRRQRNPIRGECLKVVDASLVITDPCYIVKGDDAWSKFCDDVPYDRPVKGIYGGLDMIVASTLWGDWCCELNTVRPKKRLGMFTADAGMVCVANVTPEVWKLLKKLPKTCYTVLDHFSGAVSIIHQKGVCRVEGSGLLGSKKVSFRSTQVG